MFCSGDVASFACHDDQRLLCFSTKNTPIVFGTISNSTVYEPLAASEIWNLKIHVGSDDKLRIQFAQPQLLFHATCDTILSYDYWNGNAVLTFYWSLYCI